MPSATYNDRAAPANRSQVYPELLTDAARQAHNQAHQYSQALPAGTTRADQELEALMLTIELEKDVDLSAFSSSATPGTQPAPSNNASGQPQGINQSLLMSGSRP
ncbi:hypothetical protein BX616_003376 [Lobosporangium transversale]|nr:hypothetical protein BX616_003376 [Lobosporangium transversale]